MKHVEEQKERQKCKIALKMFDKLIYFELMQTPATVQETSNHLLYTMEFERY